MKNLICFIILIALVGCKKKQDENPAPADFRDPWLGNYLVTFTATSSYLSTEEKIYTDTVNISKPEPGASVGGFYEMDPDKVIIVSPVGYLQYGKIIKSACYLQLQDGVATDRQVNLDLRNGNFKYLNDANYKASTYGSGHKISWKLIDHK